MLGILPHEREHPQSVIADIEAKYIFDGSYLDYRELIRMVNEALQRGHFGLIEEAIPDMFRAITDVYSCLLYLKIGLSKPEAVNGALVGVEAEWVRSE